MADFTSLKTAIQNAIKQNGNEEITGNLLQEILLAIVTTLGDGSINELITALGTEATTRSQADGTLQQNINTEANARSQADTALGGRIDGVVSSIEAINDAIENGYVYAGIATPSSTPASGKVFYLALTAGTYTNFGNTAVTQGINILKYNGSTWSLDAFVGIDDTPTPSSNNLVKSGGVLDSIIKDGSAFDLSAYNGGATYADLNAALTALNALPAAYKRGGMSMKFVQTSDNNYVQFRYMSTSTAAADFTNVENWQGVDAEPTAGSENLVKSGGIYDTINNVDSKFENFKDDVAEISGSKTETIDILNGRGVLPYTEGTYEMYSEYLEVLPNTDYSLKFLEGYSGSGSSARLCYELYDENKTSIKKEPSTFPTSATDGGCSFINLQTGNYNTAELKSTNYPEGGLLPIKTTADTKYIRFYIFIHSQQDIRRDPTGWTFSYQKSIPSYKIKEDAIFIDEEFVKRLPSSIVTKNLFVKEISSTRKSIWLANRNGIAQNGWYLSSNGFGMSEASSRGIDSTSELIEVEAQQTYRKYNNCILCILDDSYNFVEGYTYGITDFTTPATAKYARISFISSEINAVQLNKGADEAEYDFGRLCFDGFSGEENSNDYIIAKRNGLPWKHSYNYMREITEIAKNCTKPSFQNFIWLSDSHTHYKDLQVLGEVADAAKWFPAKFIAHTGDIIDGMKEPSKELDILSSLVRNINETNTPFLFSKGNHDDNCLYSRGSTTGPMGPLSEYILNKDLYIRTNAFSNDYVVSGSKENLYFYIDDPDTKIRSIFLNVFDNPEEEVDGHRTEDARTQRISDEQYSWLVNRALNFTDKEDVSEWGVTTYSHVYANSLSYLLDLFNAFTNGTTYTRNNITADFREQGSLEFIAMFTGDAHVDALVPENISNGKICILIILNASLAQDNTQLAREDNTVLYSPVKTFGTENETAFDFVSIDRVNHLIYLTRYGARSYKYNPSSQEFDTIANRTRIINYKNGTYTQV